MSSRTAVLFLASIGLGFLAGLPASAQSILPSPFPHKRSTLPKLSGVTQ